MTYPGTDIMVLLAKMGQALEINGTLTFRKRGEMTYLNLDGRKYNGFNAFILMLLCELQGYPTARFATFNALQRLNDPEKTPGANELPFVKVLKGERSYPVFLYTPNCINKDTGVKIPYGDWLSLDAGERDEYDVKAFNRVYSVFNIAQTNLQEARPKLWEKFINEDLRKNVVMPKDNRGKGERKWWSIRGIYSPSQMTMMSLSWQHEQHIAIIEDDSHR